MHIDTNGNVSAMYYLQVCIPNCLPITAHRILFSALKFIALDFRWKPLPWNSFNIVNSGLLSTFHQCFFIILSFFYKMKWFGVYWCQSDLTVCKLDCGDLGEVLWMMWRFCGCMVDTPHIRISLMGPRALPLLLLPHGPSLPPLGCDTCLFLLICSLVSIDPD